VPHPSLGSHAKLTPWGGCCHTSIFAGSVKKKENPKDKQKGEGGRERGWIQNTEMLKIESWTAAKGNTMRGFRCFPLQMFFAVVFLLPSYAPLYPRSCPQLCTSLGSCPQPPTSLVTKEVVGSVDGVSEEV